MLLVSFFLFLLERINPKLLSKKEKKTLLSLITETGLLIGLWEAFVVQWLSS